MNIIKVDQFNIAKFSIQPNNFNYGNEKNLAKYTLYPKYQYEIPNEFDDNKDIAKYFAEPDHCLILTDSIKIERGGIPLHSDKWRPTDNDCLYFWLNTDNPGMQNFVDKVCTPIDNLISTKTKHADQNYIKILNNAHTIVPLKKLKYESIVRSCLEYDEEGEYISSEIKKRIKVIIKSTIDKDAIKGENKKIATRIFIPENTNVPITERVFKTTPEKITCLNDLRQLVPINSTVKFVIKIQKFWANKTLNINDRPCGITLSCEQIYVIDNPAWTPKQFKFDPNKIPKGFGL